MTTQHASHGVVGPPKGEMSRRSFMRRMLGVGVGILSLSFLGGTLAFLWPNLSGGLGAEIALGTVDDLNAASPQWASGLPYIFGKANLFIVNVPAAKARVDGNGEVAEPITDPGAEVIALWRKCPHLGCQVPQLCELSQWFECLCHGSKYSILGELRSNGPAPRGMDGFSVRLQEGTYIVDTRTVINGPPPGTVNFDSRTPEDLAGKNCAG